MRWLDGISNAMDMGLGGLRELDGQGALECFSSWGGKESDMTLSTKVHLVRAMVFPVVMYGCESWTI